MRKAYRPLMTLRLLYTCVVACVLAVSAGVRADNVFMLNAEKERPQRIVVMIDDRPPPQAAPGTRSAMFGLLQGVVADLSGQELGLLLGTPMPRTRLVDARGNLERIGIAHVYGRERTKKVELLSGNEGEFLAQELEPEVEGESPRVSRLNPEKFRAVLLEWARYRGTVEPPAGQPIAEIEPGAMRELAQPYSQAPFYMDQATYGERFLRGKKSNAPPVSRFLKDEKLFVRVPARYDPRRPAGLVVWINAAQDGLVPEVLNESLDEMGMIGVGIQNVGNDRFASDRYQLALDAAWTVSRRFHVDSRRVYISGISGGGRISSMALMCFPDYFMGAVPIVGMSCYVAVPAGNGRYHRPGFQRPEAKLWALTRERPIGVITGDLDGNVTEIREGSRIMAGDGMAIRVFEFERYGHHMPSSAQFATALRWVDDVHRLNAEKGSAAAQAAFEKYIDKFGRKSPANVRQWDELMRVTELGPWTDAAWDAVRLLREADLKEAATTR